MSHTHTVISGQKSWHDPRGNHKQNPRGFPPTLQHLVKSSGGQVINEETEVQIWISLSPLQFITHPVCQSRNTDTAGTMFTMLMETWVRRENEETNCIKAVGMSTR